MPHAQEGDKAGAEESGFASAQGWVTQEPTASAKLGEGVQPISVVPAVPEVAGIPPTRGGFSVPSLPDSVLHFPVSQAPVAATVTSGIPIGPSVIDQAAVTAAALQAATAALNGEPPASAIPKRPPKKAKTAASAAPGKKKRQCRFPGCERTIKSQGHCQRHGARAKRCKVDGCEKQAQGTHNGMCKRHWKEIFRPSPPPDPEELPPEPQGESVYDSIIPASVGWKATKKRIDKNEVMPFVAFLRDGANQEPAWHRNAERKARGLKPISAPSAQFETWERQLIMFEIMLITGTTWDNTHQDLAHAWGREKGFHSTLASQICERRGKMERKSRSDAGKMYTPEKREEFRAKLSRTRMEGKGIAKSKDSAPPSGTGDEINVAPSTVTPGQEAFAAPTVGPLVNTNQVGTEETLGATAAAPAVVEGDDALPNPPEPASVDEMVDEHGAATQTASV